MKKIKLDKKKLDINWKEGGRVTSNWCNYFLIEREDQHYLIEVANWKAFLVTIFLIPFILVVLLIFALHWCVEKVFDIINQPIRPSTATFSTLFSKNKVRTDLIEKHNLQRFKDCEQD